MDMPEIKKFTTNFPASFIRELEKLSKDMKISKNDILIHAFMFWSRRKKQAMLADSYKKASEDREWMSLGDVGVDAWNNQILKWEK